MRNELCIARRDIEGTYGVVTTPMMRQAHAFIVLGLTLGLCAASCGSSAPKTGPGCSVNSDCQSPLACTYGRCHVQCTNAIDCPAGQICLRAPGGGTDGGMAPGVCRLPEEQKCGLNSMCPTGLTCAKDLACRSECVEDRDCATKTQKCVQPDHVCAEPTEIDSTGHLNPAAGSDGGAGTSDGGSTTVDAGTDAPMAADAPAGDVPAADVAVDSAPSAASVHLWVMATESSNPNLYGYTPEQLTMDATGPTPAVIYKGIAVGTYLFVLDAAGNLWGEGGGGNIERQSMVIGGPPTAGPDVGAGIGKSTVGQIFGLDPTGNLWAQSNTGVVRYDKASLSAMLPAGLTTTLSVTTTGTFFAFDKAGNLYVQSGTLLNKWTAAQLVGTGGITDPPALKLTLPAAGCQRLVADAAGNLWLLACPGRPLIEKISAAQLAATGTATATVADFAFDPTVFAMPSTPSMVFEDAGDAWITAGAGKMVKVPAAALATDAAGPTTLTPSITIRQPAGQAVTFRAMFWR
jgi:hypothetical protein